MARHPYAMAGIDLTTAETKLALWLDAEAKLAVGQRVQLGDRVLWRSDLEQVRGQIEYWQGWVTRLSNRASGISLARAVFRG